MPAGHEKAKKTSKKRKPVKDTSATGVIRRAKGRGKTVVKRRGFYQKYEKSSERGPIKTPLECTVRKSYLRQQTKPVVMRSDVPGWWGKLPEMLAGAGITMSQWRQRIFDEEPEESECEPTPSGAEVEGSTEPGEGDVETDLREIEAGGDQ